MLISRAKWNKLKADYEELVQAHRAYVIDTNKTKLLNTQVERYSGTEALLKELEVENTIIRKILEVDMDVKKDEHKTQKDSVILHLHEEVMQLLDACNTLERDKVQLEEKMKKMEEEEE